MKFLCVAALLIWGILSIVSPDTAWHLKEGWQFEDADPSKAALDVTQLIGLVSVLLGIAILLWF